MTMIPAPTSAMPKCLAKGCPYPALPKDTRCSNHTFKDPEVPAVSKAPEFEIIKMAQVPSFQVRNEKVYNIARAILALSAENALRVKVEGTKHTPFMQAVTGMVKRLGGKAKYRTGPGVIYFWKWEAGKGK